MGDTVHYKITTKTPGHGMLTFQVYTRYNRLFRSVVLQSFDHFFKGRTILRLLLPTIFHYLPYVIWHWQPRITVRTLWPCAFDNFPDYSISIGDDVIRVMASVDLRKEHFQSRFSYWKFYLMAYLEANACKRICIHGTCPWVWNRSTMSDLEQFWGLPAHRAHIGNGNGYMYPFDNLKQPKV
jgi:hypothetical protein